jgi:hypothetical protein
VITDRDRVRDLEVDLAHARSQNRELWAANRRLAAQLAGETPAPIAPPGYGPGDPETVAQLVDAVIAYKPGRRTITAAS